MISRIEREIVIEAPVEVVWDVVTEPAYISKWFSESTELDLRAGGAGTLSWKEYGAFPLRVETVEKPHLFSFRWMAPEGAEPRERNSMLVEFFLSADGENTRLRLVESGLQEIDWTEEEKAKYADDHSHGWDHHLSELVTYVAQHPQVKA